MAMSRPLIVTLSLIALAALVPSSARAIDNSTHTLGLGFQTTPVSASQTPGVLISTRFAAAPTAEFSALLGVLGTTDPNGRNGFFALAFGGKATLILLPEEFVNLGLSATLFPAIGSDGLHSFSWFVGPSLAYTPPGAPNVELFTEFGLGGAFAFSGGQVGFSPVVATVGRITVGLHYWF